MISKTVSVIIPAFNEEESISKVIEEIPKRQLESQGCCVGIVVVDNNSTDQTKKIAEAKGVKIIQEPIRGKGKAIKAGFLSANEDFIFILDADYTYPATYLPQMLKMLEEYDVVLGSRLKGKIEKGAMSRLNYCGNCVLAWLANLLYGTHITDLCTGYWGFRKIVVKNLNVDARGFDLEAHLFAQIARKGYRIGEIPINYRRRGTPSKLNSLRDGILIGKTLIKRRFRSI
jgi:dolichol-phosphate hexosyltransferase